MKNNYLIRPAQAVDISQIIELCAAHAEYEQAQYDPLGKAVQLSEDLFCEVPKLFCVVVEKEQKLIGYATYMVQYSTWDASHYVYMDCLFVKADFRGQSIGEQLMDAIKKAAKDLNCELIQWQTPDFNTRAMKFYRRMGAVSKNKERFFWELP